MVSHLRACCWLVNIAADCCLCWHRIWVRSRNCGCLVTWFCYQLIAKPGNKTAAVSWPDPYHQSSTCLFQWQGIWQIYSTNHYALIMLSTHCCHSNVAILWQRSRSTSVQVVISCLFSPNPETMQTYWQLNPYKQTSMKFKSKDKVLIQEHAISPAKRQSFSPCLNVFNWVCFLSSQLHWLLACCMTWPPQACIYNRNLCIIDCWQDKNHTTRLPGNCWQ